MPMNRTVLFWQSDCIGQPLVGRILELLLVQKSLITEMFL